MAVLSAVPVPDREQLKRFLQTRGYTDIRSIRKEPDGEWSVKAKQNGEEYSFKVDRSGTISLGQSES